ncbi:CBM35 domain-containing protein [Actinacidiphila rubida]|uniref:Carbohydrate binding module (Family 35) n=1 Tax=Actinacidiphila rubida TaxID=310780 RepID=A0A1H8FUX7_9ACTN|nr:CBM35 domain-containing protein [Actinacidiphila rubida]SEN35621.1 Carbohydrate binding module (family 35) [Actinacidiphila rubida]
MRRSPRRRSTRKRGAARAFAAALLAAAVLGPAVPRSAAAGPADAAAPEVITVDTGQQSGPMKKPGLGSLFGVASQPDTPAGLADASQNLLAQHAALDGDTSYPTSTESVAGKLAGTGVRMIVRYNDLMGGWPYVWKGLQPWLDEVDSATRSLQAYRSQVYAVAPLNEPDNKLGTSASSPFMTDPQVQGGTYDDKVNWLWTQTVRRIRAIDPTVPIMGPNYEHYNPWESADRQPRMRAFLVNAMNTGTVPDVMGWHSLGPSPGDVPESLTHYYRPLEQELHLPGAPKPVVIEEYGPGSGDFEGVPGTMVKHWAEFARHGVDAAAMGTYTNVGLLGNTLRRTADGTLQPNAGWYFENWYQQMQGSQLAVSRWDTRHYQAADGVASYDPGSRSVTLLVGGETTDLDAQILGLAARGLGPQVRVRVDDAHWTTDPGAADRTVEHGGDPQSGGYAVLDTTMTLDGSGNLTVPLRGLTQYDGYRVTVAPAAAPAPSPTKYEAEQAHWTDAVLHNGSDAALASGHAYLGGIDHADSSVAFTVNAPSAGLYTMAVRYANGGTSDATHTVTVNGRAEGAVDYPPTGGWLDREPHLASTELLLDAGTNTVTLAKGTQYAELDDIDVRPDTHRYEAEYASVTDARTSPFKWNGFPDYVGGIDNADSAVDFTVQAPAAGSYRFTVGYADGTASPATHQVLVNGGRQATMAYQPTGSWFDSAQQDRAEGRSSVQVVLQQGANHIRLQKGDGYAELDWGLLSPT